jgi:diguanylate cyclase (GGDEF)-like protein
MRSRECIYGSTGSAWKTKDGRVWFGTIAGAAAIDPRHLALRTPAPPVWLEGLMFDNRPVPVSSGARLGPGAGRLEIQFTAPNFAAASRIQFRYRLEGFDPEWIEAGARRTAYYTNVPPGSYRFHVEAAASDGGWSGKGADLKLELRPHVYQTAWFRGLCAALLVVCGAGLYLLRVRYLLWRNRELERKVAQRTEELAKTARSLAAEKSELLRARAELERLATRDGLTGIWNRRAAFDLLGRALDWCRLSDQSAAVIMCDLDGFKRINDRHGHPAGDGVLREIARRLQAGVRASDFVGRYGGEEFLIILPDCNVAEARVRAEQLRREVEDAPVEVGGVAFAVTSSFGVSCSGNCGFDGEALVREAGQALYRAKHAGKNRVEVSEEVTTA